MRSCRCIAFTFVRAVANTCSRRRLHGTSARHLRYRRRPPGPRARRVPSPVVDAADEACACVCWHAAIAAAAAGDAVRLAQHNGACTDPVRQMRRATTVLRHAPRHSRLGKTLDDFLHIYTALYRRLATAAEREVLQSHSAPGAHARRAVLRAGACTVCDVLRLIGALCRYRVLEQGYARQG